MSAEQTADAFFGIAVRCAGLFIPLHRLMPAVIAGDIAAAAADTFFLINMRVDNVAAVELFGRHDVVIGETNHLIKRMEALIVKVVGEAAYHIFDDTVAVLHDAGRNLQRRRAQQ